MPLLTDLDATALVGAAATLASTTSFLPQAWKVIRTRDTEAISAGHCHVIRPLDEFDRAT
jgi:uncharacterized protein with PQ loop repeat